MPDHNRDLQLILVGALMANRDLAVSPEWFGHEVRPLVEDLLNRRPSEKTFRWFRQRRVEPGSEMVARISERVSSMSETSAMCALASEAIALRSKGQLAAAIAAIRRIAAKGE